MPAVNDKATPKKRKDEPPAPPVSGATRRIVLTGAVFALVCAEAWSAPTLFALAEMAKVPRTLAWLLPAVLDTYAVTSILFGNSVPKGHPAHRPAISNTRRALLITVSANGVYHLLTLAGKQIPAWAPVALLITVSALPLYIADRLVYLYNLASGNGAGVEAAQERQPDTGKTTKAAGVEPAAAAVKAPAVSPSGSGSPAAVNGSRPAAVATDGSGKASKWAALALPLWQEYVTGHNGTPPTAPVLANLLRNAHPHLPIPGSPRSERIIREDTEKLANPADAEPERAMAVNS